ncbi:unnamed protein product [Arctia plantaginis]|uniref:Uncharacterized protein n=1 Tax=Arctia plantaginis TaxID=874455 RepID=A0A8S0ZJN9_ARCPL|nr:unnamed protein product [Arctia plantaginis]
MAGRDTISDLHFKSNDKHDNNHPSPLNIEAFIPWACGQLELPFVTIINKVQLIGVARSTSTRGKAKEENTNEDSQSGSNVNDDIRFSGVNNTDMLIYVDAIYDNNNLIQLKFNSNLQVPVILLKLFSLIVHFHPHLTAIYINRGLNQNGLYQVSKIVNAAKVTEVILDNTVVKEANYYILLDDNCSLKYLSLAKCKLNDRSVKFIASRLNYPLKASKTLSVLNLSSNMITDEGAKYLGDMLRMNRQLCYLNLSGNMISDIGADSILSILMTFPLTADEITQKKARKFHYMKKKNDFIRHTVEVMRIDYEKRYTARKKIGKSVSSGTKKSIYDLLPDNEKLGSMIGFDSVWLDKAETAAEEMIGPFQDAFNDENTITKCGEVYCYGNNVLCYLNLAYNSLTYFSVKKLLEVLKVQRELPRRGKGLINVCIEGNNLPKACQELTEIDIFLEIGLNRLSNMSTIKRKNVLRAK